MDIKSKVLEVLKTKVANLGFNQKEIESAADAISKTISVAENADEAAVTASVENATNSVLPLLQLSQAATSRVVETQLKKFREEEEAKKKKKTEEEEETKKKLVQTGEGEGSKKKTEEEKVPDWAAKILGSVAKLNTEIESLKSSKVSETRKEKLQAILKDTGTFGERALKSFEKMSFADESDFNTYCEDLKSDVAAIAKERADAGLGSLGNPPSKGGQKPQGITDAQIENLVSKFS